jgi:Tol biopolymer transport system component
MADGNQADTFRRKLREENDMTRKILIVSLLLALPGFANGRSPASSDHEDPAIADSAAYLGQTPPGETPVVFAPGIVSQPDRSNLKITFSPDGRECLIGVRVNDVPTILYAKQDNGHWSKPETADFLVDNQREKEPFFSPDGNRIFFVRFSNIWVSNRINRSWAAPEMIGPPVNANDAEQYHPTATADGTLYFCSNRGGQYNIYRSRCENGRYAAVEKLDAVINSHADGADGAYDPYIAPDESYIIFASIRSGGYGKEDHYISFNKGGHWTNPRNLGAKINTAGTEYGSYVSPDSKYYFFARSASAGGDFWQKNNRAEIYWVRTDFVDDATDSTVTPRAQGAYFGQSLPGETPVLFAPAILTSLSAFTGAPTFSPDGRKCFVSVGAADYSTPATLYCSECVNNMWQPFVKAPFIADFTSSSESVFSADGHSLTFTGKKAPSTATDFWIVEEEAHGWGPPVRLPSPINSDANEWRGSTMTDGTMYFGSERDRPGIYQVYKACRDCGHNLVVEKLGPPINLNSYEGDPCIAPDGHFLVFCSGRDVVSTDLYVSFSDGKGGWGAPINLGPAFNTGNDEYGAYLSHDGKYLFFTRHTSQGDGIYWVATSAIEKLRH